MTFQPTLESLKTHAVPRWYDDAKFGIFIHWGLFSIPAFASRLGSIGEAFRDHYDTAVARTPYTEWYWNAIKVGESESAAHHREVWGNCPYEDFRAPFLEGLKQWDPNAWAEAFAEAGARYVVLVTKHHDGFCLWPSAVKNPHQDGWTTERDVVGELCEAVRAKGLRFGVYYSGGIDWTFNREPLRTLGDFIGSVPGGAYPAYAEAQTRELIARYRPDILWNDISWPAPLAPMLRLFADYYNGVPDGVVNDRWMPVTPRSKLMRWKFVRRAFDRAAKKKLAASREDRGVIPPLPPHCDFRTPEYASFKEPMAKKWEATRGLSHSFGFNRADTDADYLSVDALVKGFVETIANNGNLLLNVGPRGEDAQIPAGQLARLDGFGCWLKANDEAVYGTRACGGAGDVRFVTRDGVRYAHLLGTDMFIETPAPVARVRHVATGADVPFDSVPGGIVLKPREPFPPAPAQAFALNAADS